MVTLRPYRPGDAPPLLELFRDTVRRVNRRDYPPAQVAAWASDDIDTVGLDGSRAAGDNNDMSTTAAPSPALSSRFHTLAGEWRAATRFLSAPSAASEHPAYRAVIDLGPAVVPLILAEMAAAPEPWFAALRELTGADPLPPADRGRPRSAAEHWLAWGRARGLAGGCISSGWGII